MELELALAKVNIMDVEPTRNRATNRLLNKFNAGDTTWFIQDEQLRYAYSYQRYTKSLSTMIPNIPSESGFKVHATNGPSIMYSNLSISKHALHRWNLRAKKQFPDIEYFKDINETLSSKECLTLHNTNTNSNNEFFLPVRDGAFIGEVIYPNLDMFNLSISKQNSTLGNYYFSKAKKRWVGEFVPAPTIQVIKTFLGWDELEKGGVFNTASWYREKFIWADTIKEWNSFVAEDL